MNAAEPNAHGVGASFSARTSAARPVNDSATPVTSTCLVASSS